MHRPAEVESFPRQEPQNRYGQHGTTLYAEPESSARYARDLPHAPQYCAEAYQEGARPRQRVSIEREEDYNHPRFRASKPACRDPRSCMTNLEGLPEHYQSRMFPEADYHQRPQQPQYYFSNIEAPQPYRNLTGIPEASRHCMPHQCYYPPSASSSPTRRRCRALYYDDPPSPPSHRACVAFWVEPMLLFNDWTRD